MKDTIFLNNLAVEAIIGILPHERLKKQTLIIDLALETDFTAAAESDDVADAISYADVADYTLDFAQHSEFGLLETFAAALIDALFAEFPVDAITITLQKPGAIAATREVGIKMHRRREQ
ncbi:dihydroneopterin aldolase [Suttonella ornithocola]|uniref:7,8-dihydroneopterin aldolase n=1 Tax=Suttonella ornithocola TaxID=279832 RepID=A0A380N096_9GAMM|nr:dihydroneopterin aldolase [Suttonella ornithocola]SUO97686.1 Dihydroneopterin aldolase [Suttonella ornithocola]